MTTGKAGIDPLGDFFTYPAFQSLAADNGPLTLRAFLLDREILATVTESQADAILAAAEIDGDRQVDDLTDPERHRLYRSIRDTLGRLVEGHDGYD